MFLSNLKIKFLFFKKNLPTKGFSLLQTHSVCDDTDIFYNN